MIRVEIPGRGTLELANVVFDVNGTIALDGRLLPGVAERMALLREQITVHTLTANTHGHQAEIDALLGFSATIVGSGAEDKAAFVRALGSEGVAAIGNGAIDAPMLDMAALGVAVLGQEGLAVPALIAADVVVPSVLAAFDLLLKPMRLVATLRSW